MTEHTAADARAARIQQSAWVETGEAARTGLVASIKDLWARRELILLLTRREVRARFKDSSLGMAWSFARPLTQFAVYYFALGQILGMSRAIPDFAIFVFVGLTAWLFFSESVQKATSSILVNASLVKKVQLPRAVFPLSAIGSVAFMSAIQAVVLVAALFVLRRPPVVEHLHYSLAGILVVAVFTIGVGLLLSAVNVRFRDVEHLVEVAIVVLFWASPIVYSYSFVHDYLGGNWIEQVYLANPITIGIMGLQYGLWGAGAETQVWPSHFGIRLVAALAISLVVVVWAHSTFRRREGDFAQEI